MAYALLAFWLAAYIATYWAFKQIYTMDHEWTGGMRRLALVTSVGGPIFLLIALFAWFVCFSINSQQKEVRNAY